MKLYQVHLAYDEHQTNFASKCADRYQSSCHTNAPRKKCSLFTDDQHESVTVLFSISATLVDACYGRLYSTSEKLGHIEIPPGFPPGSAISMF